MDRAPVLLFVLAALCLAGCPTAPRPVPAPAPSASTTPEVASLHPATEKRPVTDTYHGVSVSDDYRWLEDGASDEVKAWTQKQNAHARTVLDGLPAVSEIRARLTEVLSATSESYHQLALRGGSLFAIKRHPPKQQPFLIVMPSAHTPNDARVLVDPNTMDETGTTAIDFYVPSHDGKLVAVSLSKGGTETGDVHVFEVATGKRVHEIVPRVNGGTAGGTLAWAADDSGFFYSRYPRASERPDKDMNFFVQVYFHQLGTPTDKDRYEIGKDFPRIAEIELNMHQPSGRMIATVQKGDGGQFALYLRDEAGKWKQFSTYGDKIVQAAFGPKDDIYFLSRIDAPRGKVMRMPIATLDPAKAEMVVAETSGTIVESFWSPPSIVPTPTRLYVLYQLGGPSEIQVYDHAGKLVGKPKQVPVGAAWDMTRIGGDDILFSNWSFVEPPAFFQYTAARDETAKTALASSSPVDMSQVEVVREMATSKDGTKVPVNILLPPGFEKNGSMPCLVTGYGGYGISLAPRFRAYYNVLLEQGVCFAVANLRGGGEYGEKWHRDGNLTKKQNVFDDFAAVLSHMVTEKYTQRDKLAILGGSNGGLLMGATLTQHPELVKAVVSLVGIYDMLRVELSPNGAFNVTEFGTVASEDHFKALYAYSPYHNVKDGTAYPAVLMATGDNDPRVDPMQSRKMTARLQAATSSKAPIVLRTTSDAGHGGDSSLEQQITQLTEAYSFVFAQLGVTYRPVER